MTIGSAANLAFALDTLRNPPTTTLDPVDRLMLILLSESFGMGATIINFAKMAKLLGTRVDTGMEAAMLLAKCGLIKMSRFDQHQSAFVASVLATPDEVKVVRDHIRCNWPIHDWIGEA